MVVIYKADSVLIQLGQCQTFRKKDLGKKKQESATCRF